MTENSSTNNETAFSAAGENEEKIFTALLISDDAAQCEKYTNKAPQGVRILSCPTDSKTVRYALADCLPHAVFILFRKGERAAKKNYEDIFAYVGSNLLYLGVMGSRIQLDTFAAQVGGDSFTPIATPRMLREVMTELSAKYNRHLAALKRHENDRAKGRPPVVAIVYTDMGTALTCEGVLRSYSEVKDKRFRPIMIDMGMDIPDALSEGLAFPDLFIFSGTDEKLALKTINQVYVMPEYRSVPYILVGVKDADNFPKPNKKPADIVDLRDGNTLAQTAEKLLKRRRKNKTTTAQ